MENFTAEETNIACKELDNRTMEKLSSCLAEANLVHSVGAATSIVSSLSLVPLFFSLISTFVNIV